MRRVLDPTLDVVFKLLFTAEPGGTEVLIALLEAVLEPSTPIVGVEIIDPAIPRELVDDKRVVLDLLVLFADGTKVDIEMQARDHLGFRERVLFYASRVFTRQLGAGDAYDGLRPVISVVLLAFDDELGQRPHAVFRLHDIVDGSLFTGALEVHLVCLPRLAALGDSGPAAALLRWSSFLLAQTQEDADAIASTDPSLEKANTILKRLAADPDARSIAEARELSLRFQTIERAAYTQKGREEGLREAVLDFCEGAGITVTQEARVSLSRMDIAALEALRTELKANRRWPGL